nr:AAA family ATPase [Desulfobulbaceae bacterium]
MYKEFFGIQQKPFSIAPDPHFLFMSEGHREALAHLRYGLEEEGGFVLLTGEVGTGKTTVCRCLLELASDTTAIAYILQPKLSSLELLATICEEFGIAYPEKSSIKELIDLLNKFLLSIHADGKNAALIIDEAQNLSVDTLEQIRLLTNLETNQKKLLQIILLGQPELGVKLQKPELRQLAQRVSARCHLGPLSEKDSAEYVLHRLAVAKMPQDSFSAASLKALYRYTAGIPRLINTVCDRSLLAAYSKGVRRVDKSLLTVAAQEVLGGKVAALPMIPRWLIAVVTVAVCAVLLLLIRTISPQEPDGPLANALPEVGAPEVKLEKVIEYASVKEPEMKPLAKAVWPTGKALLKSEEAAFAALLRLWGFEPPMAGQWPCQFAEEKGLRCIAKQSDLENLLTLNRPAVLHMKNEQGKAFFAALTGVQGDVATLEINGQAMQADFSELSKHWAGGSVILWQPPPGYRGSVRGGQTGQVVAWLSGQLAKIEGTGYIDTASSKVYGSEHIRAIKNLQRRNNLVPDGIAGKETLIVVNSLSGAEVPFLKK